MTARSTAAVATRWAIARGCTILWPTRTASLPFERGLSALAAGASVTESGSLSLRSHPADFQKVARLVDAFRSHGHTVGELDPLEQRGTSSRAEQPSDFDLGSIVRAHHAAPQEDSAKLKLLRDILGLSAAHGEVDLGGRLTSVGNPAGRDCWHLTELMDHMVSSWCGSLSAEIGHLPDSNHQTWIIEQLEGQKSLPGRAQKQLLLSLLQMDAFYRFLALKFPSSKRFGVEGCDAVVPGLEAAAKCLGASGVRSIQIGMAHRGRLSVLSNVLNKPFGMICAEMEGQQSSFSVGDVKYHLGSSGEVTDTRRNFTVKITLAPNPSHLEAVNSVVMGMVRALQDKCTKGGWSKHAAVLLHGDAAFAGLGVVAEGLGQASLGATNIGGTIHLILNNRVGFTTEPWEGQPGQWCTDVAKGFGIPILHVNADDPEAVVRACQMAAQWRSTWHRDIVVDIVGYRRNGHNELDDPSPTAPLITARIKQHPPVSELYSTRLLSAGVVDESEVHRWKAEIESELEAEYQAFAAGHYIEGVGEHMASSWQGAALTAATTSFEGATTDLEPLFSTMIEDETVDLAGRAQEPTGLPLETLQWLMNALTVLPEGFNAHPKVGQLIRQRQEMGKDESSRVDMATAEALALGALATRNLLLGTPAQQGLNLGAYHVRLHGQDSQRGTFNQRHMVLHDQVTGEKFSPVNNLQPGVQKRVEVFNSSLNEFAALGFEYGYSVASRGDILNIWEAQFGDFANNAQVMMDNFIASGEAKWGQQSGLVLYLPHGFEGQGPDHSSARIERFLQLANDDPYHLPGYTPLHRQQIRDSFQALSGGSDTGVVTREKVSELLNELLGEVREGGRELDAQLWRELRLPEGGAVDFKRWERFMVGYMRRNAEADANFFVVNATTPAQLFHVLRRQVNRPFRKPLVLLTQKHLLHHKPCTSALEDFTDETFFNRVIDDSKASDNTRHRELNAKGDRLLLAPEHIRRVVICSGSVYYKLSQARRARRIRDIVLVRLEQIVPFPHDILAGIVDQYSNAELVYCQEEPKNMGAYLFVRPRLHTALRELSGSTIKDGLSRSLRYAGRPASATTATASFAIHQRELSDILDSALTPEPEIPRW